MKASILLVLLTLSAVALGQSPNAGPAAAPSNPNPATPAAPAQPQNGFTMVNGVMYEMRNGQLLPVTRELTLRISPNGIVTGFDERVYTIPPGVVLSVDARVVPFTGVPLSALPVATAPQLENPPPQTTSRTTIYTGSEIGSYPLGTTTFIPVPNTVFVPGTVTYPAQPLPARPVAAAPPAPTKNSGRPVTNNPFSGVAPSAFGVNTTATGNQQNTLGTQQIRPGMGNAVGTGGGPPRR